MGEEKKYRQHTIADALDESIASAGVDPAVKEEIKKRVLGELDKHRLIYYSRPDELSLMNSTGRVLIAIAENPEATQRSLSVYLGVSEGAIQKCIQTLVSSGVVAKTKVGGRNRLSIVPEKLAALPDITRFSVIHSMLSPKDDTPF